MRFRGRRGSESSGSVAGLVILLTVLAMIIFYVLAVPESQREYLNITGPQHIILDVSPGLVGAGEVDVEKEAEYNLATVIADNSPQPFKKLIRDQVLIKKGAFSEDLLSASFEIADKSLLGWVIIEGNVIGKTGSGDIILILNGKEVYSAPANLNSKASMQVPTGVLAEGINNLSIKVSSPGWSFWSTNSYQLSDINVVFGQYDSATAKVSQLVSLTEEEVTGVGRVQLTAYVSQLSDHPANIKVYVNGESVFEGVSPSSFNMDIPANLLNIGSNTIEWEVDRDGIYKITFGKIIISTTRLPAEAKKFDFSISSSLWRKIQAGRVDCEIFLKQDASRSSRNDITVRLNTNIIKSTFTSEKILLEDVCDNLDEGVNSISLSASEDVYVTKLKITLKE